MALTNWLIDKSAYLRLADSPDAEEWLDRVQRGLVRISTVTRLEIGYSARNHDDAIAESAGLLSYMPVEYFTPAIENRVIAVQLELARRGQHRAPSIPDLLIAATAEIAKLTVLAVDKDFDLIADITGQQIETLRIG